MTSYNYARLCVQLRRPQEAITLAQHAVDTARQIFPEGHPHRQRYEHLLSRLMPESTGRTEARSDSITFGKGIRKKQPLHQAHISACEWRNLLDITTQHRSNCRPMFLGNASASAPCQLLARLGWSFSGCPRRSR